MEDYSKVTFVEYMKKKKEILNSLGRTEGECYGIPCSRCVFNAVESCGGLELENPEKAIDLIMNYEIPVDWTKVPVDTPIYVRDSEDESWYPRHFAKFENEKVFAWKEGRTSFSAENDLDDITDWRLAKLKDPVKENGGE